MRHVLDMYRFVKLVDEIVQELERENPAQIQLSGYKGWHPTTVAIKQRYVEKFKMPLSKASAICADTIRKGYLEGITQTHHGAEIDTLCIKTKGRELIDNYLLIPWGLLDAIWYKHGKFLAFLAGGSLFVLIKYTLDHI